MSLTSAQWKSRIVSDLMLILGAPTADVQTDILVRATRKLIRTIDDPTISASLSVTASTGSGPYDVPSTIKRIIDIRDAETTPESRVYSYDATKNQITFQDTITEDETWTVYGTPNDIRTNVDTIVAAIDEDWEDCLWAYIKAYAYEVMNNAEFITLKQYADSVAFDIRKSRNRRLDVSGVPVQYLDVTGQRISDSDNAEGFSVNIDNDLGSDL